MTRYLIPRLAWGPWAGDTDEGGGDCRGRGFSFEWLGLMIEVAISRVRR